jgi:repressor LexA
MKTLTRKQKVVLDYITNFLGERGYAPSYEEIAKGVGLASLSTVHLHVENLRLKGFLARKWNGHRSLDLIQCSQKETCEAPLLGYIAAGAPIEALTDQENISLPSFLSGNTGTYVLRVRGDSMRDDHILDGDYVVVEPRNHARDGEMVVALIDGAYATLKRLCREGKKIKLIPANPDYPVQIYEESRVAVQGVLVGILRKY